jgi:hypothetical protein
MTGVVGIFSTYILMLGTCSILMKFAFGVTTVLAGTKGLNG